MGPYLLKKVILGMSRLYYEAPWWIFYGIGYDISVTVASNGVKRAQIRDIWSKWAKNYQFVTSRWRHTDPWCHFEKLKLVLLGCLMNLLWHRLGDLCKTCRLLGKIDSNARFVVKKGQKRPFLTYIWRHTDRWPDFENFNFFKKSSLMNFLWDRLWDLHQKWH